MVSIFRQLLFFFILLLPVFSTAQPLENVFNIDNWSLKSIGLGTIGGNFELKGQLPSGFINKTYSSSSYLYVENKSKFLESYTGGDADGYQFMFLFQNEAYRKYEVWLNLHFIKKKQTLAKYTNGVESKPDISESSYISDHQLLGLQINVNRQFKPLSWFMISAGLVSSLQKGISAQVEQTVFYDLDLNYEEIDDPYFNYIDYSSTRTLFAYPGWAAGVGYHFSFTLKLSKNSSFVFYNEGQFFTNKFDNFYYKNSMVSSGFGLIINLIK